MFELEIKESELFTVTITNAIQDMLSAISQEVFPIVGFLDHNKYVTLFYNSTVELNMQCTCRGDYSDDLASSDL